MTLLSSALYTNGHQPDRQRLGHKVRSVWATSTPVRSVLKLRRMAVRAVSSATGAGRMVVQDGGGELVDPLPDRAADPAAVLPPGGDDRAGWRFGQLLLLLSGGAPE
jgi:hypothetical protein